MRIFNIIILIGILASAWAGYEYLGGLAKDDAMVLEEKFNQQVAELEPQAIAGNPEAQLSLSRLYLPIDPTIAVTWIERAATKGHGKSQYFYGQMFELGQGVTKNLDNAVIWYQRAAKFGSDEDAQYALARLYQSGLGVGHDTVEALSWFLRAAHGGQPAAQYMVGRMFETGWGKKIDLIKSYAWYSLSNAQRARALDTNPANDPRDSLARIDKIMNDSQRDKAKSMLKRGLPFP
jgi:hypothetical protein